MSAAGGCSGQRARVEIITLGKFKQQRRGQWPLVALDQIEVGWRNAERLGHDGLREAIGPADTADGVAREKLLLGHAGILS